MSESKDDRLEDFLFSEAPLKQAAKPAKQENPPKFMNINQKPSSIPNPLRSSLPAGVNPSNKTQDDLQELIEEIPYPTEDLSLTSFTNSSNTTTPHKRDQSGHTGQKKRYGEQSNKISDGYSNEKSDNKNERGFGTNERGKFLAQTGPLQQPRVGGVVKVLENNSQFSSGDYRSFVSQTNNYEGKKEKST